MATPRTPARRVPRRSATARSTDNLRVRVNFEYREVSELRDYEFNPRDNEAAIQSVANSIRTFGFLIPVVIDTEGVLVAGHTRVAAAKLLGLNEVPTVQAGHLTEDQITAFRIIDNKVAELAKWDFDMLSGEISKLQGAGLALTDFGWQQEELDCLTDVVSSECLNVDGLVDVAGLDRIRRMERRAPATARFVCGEVVFFVSATDYRRWVDGIRGLHDYNEADIIADIKQRLGITEETVSAAARADRTRPTRT